MAVPFAEPTVVAAAYDEVAVAYDQLNARDRSVRRTLWRHFDRVFRPGDAVIDAGCGTGLDTLHLAARGVRVTAVDVSPGMIAELTRKLARPPSGVETHVGDLNDVLSRLAPPYDGIVSSFGALNTVDLPRFAAAASRLLRPGGRLVCHMLSPGRRSDRERSWTVEIGDRPVPHLCLHVDEVFSRYFSHAFVLRRAYGLGFLLRDRVVDSVLAPLTDVLGVVESVIGRAPGLRRAGRFFVLDVQRR
jgi:ubiquinone/menaquinone biosynthesis C-methylase UbiE